MKLAVAVILIANAATLWHVRTNRQGPPTSVVTLTQDDVEKNAEGEYFLKWDRSTKLTGPAGPTFVAWRKGQVIAVAQHYPDAVILPAVLSATGRLRELPVQIHVPQPFIKPGWVRLYVRYGSLYEPWVTGVE